MAPPLVEREVALRLVPFIDYALQIANDPPLFDALIRLADGANVQAGEPTENARSPSAEMGTSGSTGPRRININRNFKPCYSCRCANARCHIIRNANPRLCERCYRTKNLSACDNGPDDREGRQEQEELMVNAQNEITPASSPIISSPLGAAEDNTFADLEPALDLSMFAGPFWQTPAPMADGFGASMPFVGNPFVQNMNGFSTSNNQGSFYQPELLPFFVVPQDNVVLGNSDQETGPADMNDDFTGERL